MTKLEQLKSEYSRIKNDLNFIKITKEKLTKDAEDCEKKMKIIEEKIKEIEGNKKLFECVDYIKNYCKGKNYCCEDCKFYKEADESNKTNCLLRNNFPEHWDA